jgi:hypothetical protein
VSSKYRHLYQFCYVKVFSTNHNRNLVLLDDPGRVRSQITSVVCQIQRFDFDCDMVVSRKVIIRTRAPLRFYSLLVFDPGLEPLSDLSIEPIVKQEGILHSTCNLYTVLEYHGIMKI